MNEKKLRVFCAVGVALAASIAASGCRSTNNGSQQKKPGKLAIMSNRDCIPQPYMNPQSGMRPTKPVGVVSNVNTGQPQLPDAGFVPNVNQGEAEFVSADSQFAPVTPVTPEALRPADAGKDVKVDRGEPNSPPKPPVQKPVPEVKASSRTYKVQKGDCLSVIAYMYSVKVSDLMSVNSLKNDSIRVGQTLTLPENAATTPRPRPAVKSTPVKKGGSAPKATENTAKKTNAASKADTKAGEPIPADGFYTIRKGDNFWMISRRFKIKEEELKALNPDVANFNGLQIGQRIRLRGAGAPAPEVKKLPEVLPEADKPKAILPKLEETDVMPKALVDAPAAVPAPPAPPAQPTPIINTNGENGTNPPQVPKVPGLPSTLVVPSAIP